MPEPYSLDGLCHFKRDVRLSERLPLLASGWALLYPSMNIQRELWAAHTWLAASGKQYTDMPKFLNNWMKRASLMAEEADEKERREGDRRQAQRQSAADALAKIHAEEAAWKPDMTDEEMAEISRRNLGKP